MVKIIGICGLKSSGKSTVANIMKQYDNSYKIESFASPLKDIVSKLFNWDRALLEGETLESREWRETKDKVWSQILGRDVTPRMILQEIGTNVFRNHFFKDIWSSSLLNRIDITEDKFIIADVRFKNEIDGIKQRNGYIIRIERYPLPDWYNVAMTYNQNPSEAIPAELLNVHPSEWEWIGNDNPDIIIKNDGTLEYLQEKIKVLMRENKL